MGTLQQDCTNGIVAGIVNDYNTKIGDLTTLSTTDKTSLVKALNELKADIELNITGIKSGTSTAFTAVTLANTAQNTADTGLTLATKAEADAQSAIDTINTSGFQTADQVNTAIQTVVGVAPDTLNTLQKIAIQLQSDETATSALVNTITAVQTLATQAETDAQAGISIANAAKSEADSGIASIGTLTNLTTTDKSNLVKAINEVLQNVQNAVSIATTAQTTAEQAESDAQAAAILPDTGVTAGSYGNISNIPIITVNSKGVITDIATVDVSG